MDFDKELQKWQVTNETLQLMAQQKASLIQHVSMLKQAVKYMEMCKNDKVNLQVGYVQMEMDKQEVIGDHNAQIKDSEDKIESIERRFDKLKKDNDALAEELQKEANKRNKQ